MSDLAIAPPVFQPKYTITAEDIKIAYDKEKEREGIVWLLATKCASPENIVLANNEHLLGNIKEGDNLVEEDIFLEGTEVYLPYRHVIEGNESLLEIAKKYNVIDQSNTELPEIRLLQLNNAGTKYDIENGRNLKTGQPIWIPTYPGSGFKLPGTNGGLTTGSEASKQE